jgi:probable F420-dependent oxidoreductase
MRFVYYFPGRWVPIEPSLLTLDAHIELAVAAERSGFDGLAVDEHPIPSEAWRQAPGGHDALDPFITLAAVASSVHLRLVTYAAVVPYRNPFLLAKQVATLDVLSGGRLIVGVGTGYLAGEFEALGVDFEQRNALFDEGLVVMKLAWRGEPVDFEGLHFTANAVTALPRPVCRPHPPLWIGGNSKLTMRRVVDAAQGWMPMPNPRRSVRPGRTAPLETIADLRALRRYLDDYAASQGRVEPIDVVCSLLDAPADRAALVAHLGELASVGVTWVTVNGEGRSLSEAREWIGEFGNDVIAPTRQHPGA